MNVVKKWESERNRIVKRWRIGVEAYFWSRSESWLSWPWCEDETCSVPLAPFRGRR